MSVTHSSPHFHYLEICWLSFKFKEKCYFVFDALKMKVTKSCLTLCDPLDYSPPGSSVHGILQTRILEWVSVPFSRDQTQVSCTAGGFFTIWATKEAHDALKVC